MALESLICGYNLSIFYLTVTSSDQDRSCILLLRLQAAGGSWRWIHCVLQVKDATEATTSSTSNAASNTSTQQHQQQQQSNNGHVPQPPPLPPNPQRHHNPNNIHQHQSPPSVAGQQQNHAATPTHSTNPTSSTVSPGGAQTPQQQGSSQQPVIVATNQVLGDREAGVLRSNTWLYHYYTMQSKLQYGLAYDAHAQRVHAYYPQVMTYHVSY